MFITAFATIGALLAVNVGNTFTQYSNNSPSGYVGYQYGCLSYATGTVTEINSFYTNGDNRIFYELPYDGSLFNFDFYTYQTYSDNLYVYWNVRCPNEKINLKVETNIVISYGNTRYFSRSDYFNFSNQTYANVIFDERVGGITANPIITSDLTYFVSVNLVPVSEYEYTNDYWTAYEDGYGDGYDIGVIDGENHQNQTFLSLFAAIADTPILMLRSLFSFDLFGISVLAVVLTLLTALICIGIVRKFGK